jgi:hypothetical protein
MRPNAEPLLQRGYSISGEQKRSPITLITALYLIGNKSKHDTSRYLAWVSNFYPTISTPIITFTTCDLIHSLKNWRHGLPGTAICYNLDDVPAISKNKYIYSNQNAMDPEKSIHSEELYKIWNAKSWLVLQVAIWNPYKSKYFFWVDAGSFRENRAYHNWPHYPRLEDALKERDNTVLLGLIACPVIPNITNFQEDDGPLAQTMIEGGFFGSTLLGISWWASEFYRLHDKYAEQGKFIGKDQEIMNVLALRNPDRVTVIDTQLQDCSDPWFYFQPFLASKAELNQKCHPVSLRGKDLLAVC